MWVGGIVRTPQMTEVPYRTGRPASRHGGVGTEIGSDEWLSRYGKPSL
jgi:hypothetical protein